MLYGFSRNEQTLGIPPKNVKVFTIEITPKIQPKPNSCPSNFAGAVKSNNNLTIGQLFWKIQGGKLSIGISIILLRLILVIVLVSVAVQ